MRIITEEEAYALAGDANCPVLRKEEAEFMEAAVCLKQFPNGYVVGVSDKVADLQLWFTVDLSVAGAEYDRYVEAMRRTGTPFGTLASGAASSTRADSHE